MRQGRYHSALGLMLFLLSSVLVLAMLLTIYHRKSEGTVPTQYHYRLEDFKPQVPSDASAE